MTIRAINYISQLLDENVKAKQEAFTIANEECNKLIDTLQALSIKHSYDLSAVPEFEKLQFQERNRKADDEYNKSWNDLQLARQVKEEFDKIDCTIK